MRVDSDGMYKEGSALTREKHMVDLVRQHPVYHDPNLSDESRKRIEASLTISARQQMDGTPTGYAIAVPEEASGEHLIYGSHEDLAGVVSSFVLADSSPDRVLGGVIEAAADFVGDIMKGVADAVNGFVDFSLQRDPVDYTRRLVRKRTRSNREQEEDARKDTNTVLEEAISETFWSLSASGSIAIVGRPTVRGKEYRLVIRGSTPAAYGMVHGSLRLNPSMNAGDMHRVLDQALSVSQRYHRVLAYRILEALLQHMGMADQWSVGHLVARTYTDYKIAGGMPSVKPSTEAFYGCSHQMRDGRYVFYSGCFCAWRSRGGLFVYGGPSVGYAAFFQSTSESTRMTVVASESPKGIHARLHAVAMEAPVMHKAYLPPRVGVDGDLGRGGVMRGEKTISPAPAYFDMIDNQKIYKLLLDSMAGEDAPTVKMYVYPVVKMYFASMDGYRPTWSTLLHEHADQPMSERGYPEAIPYGKSWVFNTSDGRWIPTEAMEKFMDSDGAHAYDLPSTSHLFQIKAKTGHVITPTETLLDLLWEDHHQGVADFYAGRAPRPDRFRYERRAIAAAGCLPNLEKTGLVTPITN